MDSGGSSGTSSSSRGVAWDRKDVVGRLRSLTAGTGPISGPDRFRGRTHQYPLCFNGLQRAAS
jgi:hypothetical protein